MPPHYSRTAITAVLVIAVIGPVLGAPAAHPADEHTTPDDVEGHGSTDCQPPILSESNGDRAVDTGTVPVADTAHNTSERGEQGVSGDDITETIGIANSTIRSTLLCHTVPTSTSETDDQSPITLERLTNAAVRTLNRTGGRTITVVDTVEHGVVRVVNRTVVAVRLPGRTERQPTTPPTEANDDLHNATRTERTDSAPVKRTISAETERRQSTPSIDETVPNTPTPAATATTPAATTTRQPTNVHSSSPETTTEHHPDRETTTVSLPVSVQSPPDNNDGGSNAPRGTKPPFEPERKTGAAVGLSATAVRLLLRHGSTASETVSRPHAVSVQFRLTTVLSSLSQVMVLLRYSRYDDSDPLEHDGREIVFEAIEETPGIYLSAINSHTEFSLSTLRHHLRVLEREELITSVKVHGKRRFYPTNSERIELTAALGEEATANVIEALSDLGPVTVSELADELDRDPSTVTHHLQRLDDDDLVCRKRSGRVVINRLSDDVMTYLTEQPERIPTASSAD
ncbi:winged helix-turn-helix transcriptional regulator [Halocatena pleomorpha]|uniref:ArsR family transcriptional regulator n=1 Tax=Halocatena pleomorpha TaxID=1785090 RepID=A0A3P3RIA0_9EURY|nr:helix-turn-helix domain-containing protein [Halocatena pleomorpha]RRJ32668.1 ArsR family transcriptional regulator [Halocatena pleomorpha]